MSEFINNTELRIKQLYAFVHGIIHKREKGAELIRQYKNAIEQVQPSDVVVVVVSVHKYG